MPRAIVATRARTRRRAFRERTESGDSESDEVEGAMVPRRLRGDPTDVEGMERDFGVQGHQRSDDQNCDPDCRGPARRITVHSHKQCKQVVNLL